MIRSIGLHKIHVWNGKFTKPKELLKCDYQNELIFETCYILEIGDLGDNGFCCANGQGWYRLTANDDQDTIYEFTGAAASNFSERTHRFKTGSLVGNDIIRSVEDHLSVFPNPQGMCLRYDLMPLPMRGTRYSIHRGRWS